MIKLCIAENNASPLPSGVRSGRFFLENVQVGCCQCCRNLVREKDSALSLQSDPQPDFRNLGCWIIC